jgi:hypothetical protein
MVSPVCPGLLSDKLENFEVYDVNRFISRLQGGGLVWQICLVKDICDLQDQGVDVMITIFCDFSANKMAFFSKNNVMINFFQNLTVVWAKNAKFFAKFFGENIFKSITSVPDSKLRI